MLWPNNRWTLLLCVGGNIATFGIKGQCESTYRYVCGDITTDEYSEIMGATGCFQLVGAKIMQQCRVPRIQCGANETPLSLNAICRLRQNHLLNRCLQRAQESGAYGRCIEAAEGINGISIAQSGPKTPWPNWLVRPPGCRRTCAMPKTAAGAGQGCTISSGGIIPRPGGYTWIPNCPSCLRVIKANPNVIIRGTPYCPRTLPEIAGSFPLVPVPPQRNLPQQIR